MSALCTELTDRRGYHRMRLDANSASGDQRGTQFPPVSRGRTHRSPGANCAHGKQRQVRALQDDPLLRRHLAEPAMARLNSQGPLTLRDSQAWSERWARRVEVSKLS